MCTVNNLTNHSYANSTGYHTVENFRGSEFRGFVAICEIFSAKLEGVASFGSDTSKQSANVFSTKIFQFTKVFSLETFPLYNTKLGETTRGLLQTINVLLCSVHGHYHLVMYH